MREREREIRRVGGGNGAREQCSERQAHVNHIEGCREA